MEGYMPLNVTWEDHEIPQVRVLLDRALGCLSPQDWPDWAQTLSDDVDKKLAELGKGVITPAPGERPVWDYEKRPQP